MKTYTLVPPLLWPPAPGDRVTIRVKPGPVASDTHLVGTVTRVEGHEIRVQVGGRRETLPFQQHDGSEWTYHEVEGDEPGPKPDQPLFGEEI